MKFAHFLHSTSVAFLKGDPPGIVDGSAVKMPPPVRVNVLAIISVFALLPVICSLAFGKYKAPWRLSFPVQALKFAVAVLLGSWKKRMPAYGPEVGAVKVTERNPVKLISPVPVL